MHSRRDDERVNALLTRLRIAQAPQRYVQGITVNHQPSLPGDDPIHAIPKRPSGPKPPASWMRPLTSRTEPDHSNQDHDARWRASILQSSFNLAPLDRGDIPYALEPVDPTPFPSLQHLCIERIVFGNLLSLISAEYLTFLPTHLRALIIRCAAIHSPLSRSELEAMWGTEGNTSGEVVIAGQKSIYESSTPPKDASLTTSLREQDNSLLILLRHLPSSVSQSQQNHSTPENSWDASSDSDDGESGLSLIDPSPIRSLVLFDLPIPPSLRLHLCLPATLAHLSLIHLAPSQESFAASPISFSLLSRACPLLRTLDVSLNRLDLDDINQTRWGERWASLRVFVIRGAWTVERGLQGDFRKPMGRVSLSKVNEKRVGRWINIVL